MAFQTAITIKEALDNIHRHKYALPAIQRELVWRPSQIERLFDSLMRGYPIGSFLFWRVNSENVQEYKFYDFVLNYHQKKAQHNQPLNVTHTDSDLIAILDGQQRLTALNIGLRGSHASKAPRLWWNNPRAFPVKRLYLNLLSIPEENEDGIQYEFKFLSDSDANKRDKATYWYRVSDILKVEDRTDLIDAVHDIGLGNTRNPLKMLNTLHHVVHDDGIISFYEEKSQDLHKVLNIFVRINSAGTVLSYSDILLSIATAQWDKFDAREEIYGLVDDINQIGNGFSFSKDFVLKAGLMLSEINDIGFKVTNFNAANMARIQDEWERIKISVRNTVELAAGFGYSSATLSSTNALMPIAYYIHRNKLAANLLFSSKFKQDRDAINYWLVRSLLKRGVWGSGLDSLLIAIRSAIRDSKSGGFPSAHIETTMRRRGKGLTFDSEELEDLIDTRYGDQRAYGILMLLYSFIDVQTNHFHIDHVFPRARMTESRLRKSGIVETEIQRYIDNVNGIANLQLLTDVVNQEKSDKLPAEWLSLRYPDSNRRKEHLDLHDLGNVPEEVTCFNEFYDARRKQMLKRLSDILGVAQSGDAIAVSEG